MLCGSYECRIPISPKLRKGKQAYSCDKLTAVRMPECRYEDTQPREGYHSSPFFHELPRTNEALVSRIKLMRRQNRAGLLRRRIGLIKQDPYHIASAKHCQRLK